MAFDDRTGSWAVNLKCSLRFRYMLSDSIQQRIQFLSPLWWGTPLSGWRYWRVFSIGTNDIVIETGAVDVAGPGTLNYTGYYLGKSTQIKYWEEYLRYIKKS